MPMPVTDQPVTDQPVTDQLAGDQLARDQPLAGRIALVTGVSRRIGIGYTIASRLAALGACVYATGWPPHDAEMPQGRDDNEPTATTGTGKLARS